MRKEKREQWDGQHTDDLGAIALAGSAGPASRADQRLLEVELSPDDGTALADVLETALCMTTIIMGRSELELDEPSDGELAYLAMQGRAFDWLAEEPDLYSDEDLQEQFE